MRQIKYLVNFNGWVLVRARKSSRNFCFGFGHTRVLRTLDAVHSEITFDPFLRIFGRSGLLQAPGGDADQESPRGKLSSRHPRLNDKCDTISR